jgi:hypothetical protein
MLPLIAGLVALCGVVLVGVIDATDLALTRTSLQSSADGAALVGAESFDPAAATFDGTHLRVRLTDRGVRRAARGYLRDSVAPGRLASAGTSDGRTAEVTLRLRWNPPIVSELLPLRLTITATARARSVFTASN